MNAKQFLIIQTAFIGDVILATALIETIHASDSDIQIDILVRKGNEALFDGHPFLKSVLIWKKKEGKFKSLWNLLKQIRKQQYDVVINLQRYGSTGLLTALSKAPVQIGFDKNPFSRFFTTQVPHKFEKGSHEILRNHQLIKAFMDQPCDKPKLYPTPSHFTAVSKYKDRPYVCIAPSSVWFTKQYHTEGWVNLINTLPAHYAIYLLGAQADFELSEYIRSNTIKPLNIRNLCGKLVFLESAALMLDAEMNYVNDSAPMHIASAMNAPVTAIFCSTIPDFGYGPLSHNAHVVQVTEPLKCRPCGIHGHRACPEGHFKCAADITTSQLLATLK